MYGGKLLTLSNIIKPFLTSKQTKSDNKENSDQVVSGLAKDKNEFPTILSPQKLFTKQQIPN